MDEISDKDIGADNTDDAGSNYTIETVNSLLGNMNQEFTFTNYGKQLDENDIEPNEDFYDKYFNSDDSKFSVKHLFFRFLDSLSCFILVISFIFLFVSLISAVFEVAISYYSVIMMNYVFFVSSIVSYTMAPIYQSLAKDWLNFVFSFTQVILASPLIAFYIFYILKSVVSLAEFISDIPSVITHISYIIMVKYKELFLKYLSYFCDFNVDLIFKQKDMLKIVKLFVISLCLIIVAAASAYVLFCFDKTIIIFGSVCWLINTMQIFILVIPSYQYFFKTLVNKKCDDIVFVEKYIERLNNLLHYFPDESEDQEDSEESEKSNGSEDSNQSEEDYFESVEFDSDESDSVLNKKISQKDIEAENNRKRKLVDDPYIGEFVDEHKEAHIKTDKLINMSLHLITASSYFPLYYYSQAIAFDKHEKKRKIALLYVFFILNLAVIVYDIYQLTQSYSLYFLISVVIRFLLIPLFAYYNMLSIFFYKSKDTALNIVLIFSSVLTIAIAIAIFICFKFTDIYQNKYRINNLNFVPLNNNITIANLEMINHPICDYSIFGVSALDAFGYSLGGFDVKRNITVFDNQMKIFFGENYSSHISYKINEIDEHFLFMQYYDSAIDTHIFGFRGYNSGPEVAFQLEILATHYFIPFFEDIVPFYELINDLWLDFYTDFLISFGFKFFDNNNLMVKYINLIVDVYEKANFTEDDKVFFAGINCGGVVAKIVGSLLHRKSISFISFPIDNDMFDNMFGFSTAYVSLVTNVYNVDGFFSGQEPRFATNIAIDMPVFDQNKFCTSGVCELASKTDNVYRTFCTISEICGKGNKFDYYCESAIGRNDIETIRESLMEED